MGLLGGEFFAIGLLLLADSTLSVQYLEALSSADEPLGLNLHEVGKSLLLSSAAFY